MKEAAAPPGPTSQLVVGKYSDLSNLELTDGAIVYVASEEKLVVKRPKSWTFIQVRTSIPMCQFKGLGSILRAS